MKSYFYKLVSLLFLVGIAGVAAIALWLVRHPYPLLSNRPVAAWTPELQVVGGDVPAAPANAYAETFSRPIFSPTRRPFQVAVAAAPVEEEQQPEPDAPEPEPAAAPDSTQLLLKGIFISANASSALIVSPDKPEGAWIVAGDEVAGWKLLEINKDSVSLSAAGQSIELKQYVEKSEQGLGTDDPNQ